jgi:acylglycerol lipase
MKNQIYSLKAADGKMLFAQSWSPDIISEKLIILIHGLGEHSSRYESWASLFTDKGYTFLSMDLRGHGRSEGKKGHTSSIKQLLNDIDLLFNKADEFFPGYKKILYGHSMGGTLALNYVILRNRPIDALIVTSPWLKLVNEPSGMLLAITNFIRKFLPSLTISNGLKAEQISRDPEIVKNYASDPLVHDRISLKMFHEIYTAGYFAFRNIYKINYPFLLMHGTADSIVSPRASEDYVRNTSKRTRLKLWENQYHELHNELIRQDVFEYIITWLSEYKL